MSLSGDTIFHVVEKIGGEVYVFLYKPPQADAMLGICRTYAANPDLSFTWLDAAGVSYECREALENES